MKHFLIGLGITSLLILASVGWIVLFVQNPVLLAKARWHYLQTHDLVFRIDGHTIEMSPKGEIIDVQ